MTFIDPAASPESDLEEPQSPWQRALRGLNRFLGLPVSPMLDWTFSESQINNFFAATISTSNTAGCVDDQTWKDLNLSAYRDKLGVTTSIFGQQALHLRLRSGNSDQTSAAKSASIARIQNLVTHKLSRTTLGTVCKPLREQDSEVTELLFTRDAPAIPPWVRFSGLIPASLVASALAFAFTPFSFLAGAWFIATALTIIVLQQQLTETLDNWNREARSLRQMLATFTRIGKIVNDADTASSLAQIDLTEFTAVADYASLVNRRITRTPAAIMPVAGEYFDWFLFTNVRHYAKCQAVIMQARTFLQTSFAMLANLEADLAVARHLALCISAEEPRFCWASHVATPSFSFTNLVHPLLHDAAPLSISVDGKSVVLTGQNGIGKSTLMKAIGLSLITNRALGFCYADSATASLHPVYVTLNTEDNLATGESLYIAELRRARELLALAQSHEGCVCLIDEIFRGTNHLESVAAAGAVLNRLRKNATVIVSSHHAVLAPLLANSFAPFYLRMQGDDVKTLQLQRGVLSEPNGIVLLSKHGFEPEIQADAHAVLNWINDYLAHPTEEPNIFK